MKNYLLSEKDLKNFVEYANAGKTLSKIDSQMAAFLKKTFAGKEVNIDNLKNKISESLDYMESHLPENWLKEQWFIDLKKIEKELSKICSPK